MKSLVFAAMTAAVCSFVALSPDSANACSPVCVLPDALGGESIVMEDAILMRADTENEAETISSIEISQSGYTVLSVQGCGLKTCTVDLSSLVAGTYLVEVTTSLDRVISDNVTLL